MTEPPTVSWPDVLRDPATERVPEFCDRMEFSTSVPEVYTGMVPPVPPLVVTDDCAAAAAATVNTSVRIGRAVFIAEFPLGG
jgi:hypothetical protein